MFAVFRILAVLATLPTLAVALDPPTPPGVSGSGQITLAAIAEGDSLPFVLTLKNSTKSPLEEVRLLQLPAGYRLTSICRDVPSTCRPIALDTSTESIAIGRLEAGTDAVVWGTLQAVSRHKTQRLFLILGWKASSLAVDLGENEVESHFWVRFSDYVTIIGIPSIPLIVVVFTFLLNWLLSKHSLRSEIWKQMLPVSHGYAAKFYLPLSSAADALADKLKRSDEDLGFFYLLLFIRRMLDTIKEVGGLHFKDKRGETLAADCWNQIRNELLGDRKNRFYQSAYEAAEKVDAHDTYDKFLRRHQMTSKLNFTNRAMSECWGLFSELMRKERERMKSSATYLEALAAVLDVETARPYEHWYDATLPPEVEGQVLALLKTRAEDAGMSFWKRYTYFFAWKVKQEETGPK